MSEITHIGQLAPDRRNARAHNPRNIGMIVSALNEVGAARSIVIDEDGAILAGNGTVDAAAQAGIERVRVVDADGEEIIAVRRSGLTAEQKQRLALYDNRTAELATWDADTLRDIAGEIDTSSMFSADELAAVLRGATREPLDDPGAQVDRGEEFREKWQTERGQLWEIGRHRLLCGDATNAEDVARLMAGERASLIVTDPPYGLGDMWSGLQSFRGHEQVANDRHGSEHFAWLDTAFAMAEAEAFGDDVVAYVWFGWANFPRAMIEARGYDMRGTIIWAKEHFNVGRADYQSQHEGCLYFSRGRRYWCGDRDQSDLWQADRVEQERLHPTQKPLSLIARQVRNSSNPGEIVYDPFVGSGTTIVAAEQEGRTCYAMDIDPKYVAVSLERLAGMGLEARLV